MSSATFTFCATLIATVGFVTTIVVTRTSRRRWVTWADDAVDYAKAELLQIGGIDSDAAVDALRVRFDAWCQIVHDGARYCRTAEAAQLRWVNVPAPPNVPAYNDEHLYILHATAERVRRLRHIAARLERGETELRISLVPPVKM